MGISSPVLGFLPGRCGFFQPAGDVHSVANHRHFARAPQRPRKHRPGVETGAKLQTVAREDRRQRAGIEAGDYLPHLQGGAHSPPGVVLVGNRRAEEGHQARADVFVHGTAEARDDGVEAGPELAKKQVHFLDRRQILQRAETGHPGEKHRHLLALALSGGAQGGELLLQRGNRRIDDLIAQQGSLCFQRRQRLFDTLQFCLFDGYPP